MDRKRKPHFTDAERMDYFFRWAKTHRAVGEMIGYLCSGRSIIDQGMIATCHLPQNAYASWAKRAYKYQRLYAFHNEEK